MSFSRPCPLFILLFESSFFLHAVFQYRATARATKPDSTTFLLSFSLACASVIGGDMVNIMQTAGVSESIRLAVPF